MSELVINVTDIFESFCGIGFATTILLMGIYYWGMVIPALTLKL